MEVRINYEALRWAEEFHSSPEKHCCLAGGLGSGKTYASLQELKLLALENPGFTYLIGRQTMPSLRDTTMKSFFQVMEPELIKPGQAGHNKTHNIVTLVNDAKFIFRPLDDKEKMKSLEIAGFYINEANEVTREMYETLKGRVREKVHGKEPTMYRTVIDLNPGEEDHWIPQIFLHERPTGHKMFTSTTMDNIKNLPSDYVEELKRTYSPDMQQRMIYGLFGKVHKGRPVYPQFSRGNYVSAIEYLPDTTLVRGWDFGYNHPAVVWAQVRKNQLRILAELMGKDIYLEDFIKNEVLPYQATIFGIPKTKILDYCDPRGSDQSDKGKTSIQILNENGIHPLYRRTWIEEGIKAVKKYMDEIDPDTQEPNFLIHPRCKVSVEGLRGGYARADGEEMPKKDDYYDHLQDDIRYIAIHSSQRARILALNSQGQAQRVYTNPVTGRRIEL